MARRAWMAAILVFIGVATAGAADLTKVERRLVKEPAYTSGSPRYALLVIGPEARDRVWLVKDGDTLYVDRNGNGDLTDPGEKLTADKGGSAVGGYTFEAADFTVGGKKHKGLTVTVKSLKALASGKYGRRADIQAAFAKDPTAEVLRLSVGVTAPHLKAKGQVTMIAGAVGLDGPLLMAAKPSEAPVIHFGGPLAVTFYFDTPALRRGRTTECILVVGTPGLGAGTFASIGYDGVIPESVYPTAEITFPPVKAGAPPVKKLYELKKRC